MSLRHALLGLLEEHPASGYELTKRFEMSLANVWSATHSQIYPELSRMADAGLVVAGAEGARGRKEYRITPEGSAELRRWLTTDRDDRSMRRDLGLLRAFFLWTLPADEIAAYFERERDAALARLAELDELDAFVPWDHSGSDLMGRIVLEQGRRLAKGHAQWAAWAAGEIAAGRDATDLKGRIRS
jgi:DNA-binding PadR family transcriptional regulator